MSPAVSIIIPCYDHGRFLPESIESVEKCPPGLCELIVVDDGSTDAETRDLLDKLAAAGYSVIRQVNKGVGAARNTGIRASSGKFILPLDSDNKIRPRFLEQALEVLIRDESIGVVYGDMQYFGSLDFRATVPRFDITEMLFLNYIDACAMFRRTVWEEVGGYDENMPRQGVEDWEFWLSAYSLGWKFEHIDEIAQDYRAVDGSMLQKLKEGENYLLCKEYVFRKHPDLVKVHYDRLASWEYHGRQLRSRPFYAMFRLVLSALFPKLHDRRYKRQ